MVKIDAAEVKIFWLSDTIMGQAPKTPDSSPVMMQMQSVFLLDTPACKDSCLPNSQFVTQNFCSNFEAAITPWWHHCDVIIHVMSKLIYEKLSFPFNLVQDVLKNQCNIILNGFLWSVVQMTQYCVEMYSCNKILSNTIQTACLISVTES